MYPFGGHGSHRRVAVLDELEDGTYSERTLYPHDHGQYVRGSRLIPAWLSRMRYRNGESPRGRRLTWR